MDHDLANCRFKKSINKTGSNYGLLEFMKSLDINRITGDNLECSDDAMPELIRIPVLVNGSRRMAIVDSGANISCINLKLKKELRIPLNEEGYCKLKFTDKHEVLAPTATVTIKIRKKETVLSVSVIDMEEDILLGLDLMNTFGIALTNLPFLYPDDERMYIEDVEDISESRTLKGVRRIPLEEVKILMDALQGELEANARISSSSVNSHPDGEFSAEFKGDSKPVYVAQYKTSKLVEEAIDAKVAQWIDKGIVYRRRSNWSFPLLGAPKKDLNGERTEVRVCWDGRRLNTMLKDCHYTMPLISKIFTNCGDRRYFSIIDLAEAFHQLPVHPEWQSVLSFTWKGFSIVMQDVLLELKRFQPLSKS